MTGPCQVTCTTAHAKIGLYDSTARCAVCLSLGWRPFNAPILQHACVIWGCGVSVSFVSVGCLWQGSTIVLYAIDGLPHSVDKEI